MSVHRDLLHVDDPDSQRFALGLELLQNGEAVVFRGPPLRLSDGELCIDVVSSWGGNRVTTESARSDLKAAAAILGDLIAKSAQLGVLVASRQRRFILLDDYHTGAIQLCQSLNGETTWFVEEPPDAG